MKAILHFLLLLLFGAGSMSAKAQCSISNLGVLFSPCDTLGQTDVTVLFQYQNPSSDSFRLYLNQALIGQFAYSQVPLLVEDIPSSNPYMVVKVQDAENGDCRQIAEFGAPDCGSNPCHISDVQAEFSACDGEGNFDAWVSFSYNTNPNDTFELLFNGVSQGYYTYNQLPIYVPQYSTSAPLVVIKVIDLGIPCYALGEEPSPDCNGGGDCEISGLEATFSDCDEQGRFDITIDFEVENPGSGMFNLWLGLNLYGTYPYAQLPLTIEDYSTTQQHVRIKVADQQIGDCFRVIEPAAPACAGNGDCEISGLNAQFSDCDAEGHFDITINFQVDNPGSDQFNLWLGNEFYGSYPYAQLPLVIEDYTTSQQYVLIRIADQQTDGCYSVIEPLAPNCVGDCEISQLSALFSDCDEEGGFDILVNFEVENPGSGLFNLWLDNEFYASYPYAQLPIRVENYHSSLSHVRIKVIDQQIGGCYQILELAAPDCAGSSDCEISGLNAQFSDCDEEGHFDITINFQVDNPGSTQFDLWLGTQLYGTYPYSALPITIQNYSTMQQHVRIKVADQQIGDCFQVIEPAAPDCASGCSMSNLGVSFSPCDSNGLFDVVVQFEVANPSSDSFQLYLNQVLQGTYPYQQGYGQAVVHDYSNNTPLILVKVIDQQNPDCRKIAEFFGPDCSDTPCHISNIEASFSDCDEEGHFDIEISFSYNASPSDTFELRINGVSYGYFHYESLPIVIEDYAGGGDWVAIKVIDPHIGCYALEEFAAPDCSAACPISAIVASTSICENNVFDLLIDLQYQADPGESFGLLIDGQSHQYTYGDLPLLFPDYSTGDSLIHIVAESFAGDCSTEIDIPAPICIGEPFRMWAPRAFPNPGSDGFTIEIGNSRSLGQLPGNWVLYYGPMRVDASYKILENGQVYFDMRGYPKGVYTLLYEVDGARKQLRWLKM